MDKIEINRTNELKIDINTPEGQAQIMNQLKEIKDNPNINKPSREECDQFKKEYEQMEIQFSTSKWPVGIAEDGENLIDYIRYYSRERHLWKSNEWMGVIKLQEELDNSEKEYINSKREEPIKFSYPALEFMFHMFQNPGGIGYQSALDFESENEVYALTFDELGVGLQEARKALQTLDFTKQKWQAAEQGFYLEMDEPIQDDQESTGAYFDEELGREVKAGEPGFNLEKFQKFIQEKYLKELEESKNESGEEVK